MEKGRVIRSAGVVGSFTLLSRVLGLTRDVLMAGFFGASLSMSAFVVAFTIPNLFRRLFGEGALSAAFVPVFIEAKSREGLSAAWALARKVATLAGLVLAALVVLGVGAVTLFLVRPEWVAALSTAVGRPELAVRIELILPLLRIMLPYMWFICMAALAMAILNSFHHFAVPASTPALLNVVWIFTLLVVCPHVGETAEAKIAVVAWAVVATGVLQLAVQFPILTRHGYRPGVSLDWRDERVGRVLRLMGPAALGLAVTQVNVVIDRLLAAWVSDAAPAALFYSERLIYFPLGIFGVALGTVLLPVLAGHEVDDNRGQGLRTIGHSLRVLLFIMIPASVGLLVLARPIVRMIFEWRSFTAADTDYTRIALQFYAPGLVVFSLAKVFVPAFYARQDTKTPVKVGVCTVLLNLVLNLTFVLTWPQAIKHAGLACATVISEGVYALVLAFLLHRRVGSPGWGRVLLHAGRALAAAAVMGVAVVFLYPVLGAKLAAWGFAPKVVQVISVLVTAGAGVLVYLAAAWVVRCPELKELAGVFRRDA